MSSELSLILNAADFHSTVDTNQPDRQTDRHSQTDRQAGRQAGRQADRQTDRVTHTHTASGYSHRHGMLYVTNKLTHLENENLLCNVCRLWNAWRQLNRWGDYAICVVVYRAIALCLWIKQELKCHNYSDNCKNKYIYDTHAHLPHIMHHVDFKEQCLMLATKWQTRLTFSLLLANKAEGCGWLVTLNKCIRLTGFINLSLSQGRRRYMQGMIKWKQISVFW